MMFTTEINLDTKALASELKGNVAENARKLGITRGHLNNVLKGNKKPSIGLFLKIINTFQIPPQKILRSD